MSAIPSVRAPVSDNDQNPAMGLVGSGNTPISAEEISSPDGREPEAQGVAGQGLPEPELLPEADKDISQTVRRSSRPHNPPVRYGH